MANSGNDLDSPGFTLDADQDALNDAAAFVEECNRRHIESCIPNIAESYCGGNLELVLRVILTGNQPRENYLAFRAVSRADIEFEAGAFDPKVAREDRPFERDFVLHRVDDLVQTPQGFVPSLIRLERHHQIEDGLRDVHRSSPTVAVFLRSVLVEGEVRISATFAACESDGKTELIKRRSEIVCGVSCDTANSSWDGLSESQAKEAIARIDLIILGENFVRVSIKESRDKRFKFSDVFLRVLDAAIDRARGTT